MSAAGGMRGARTREGQALSWHDIPGALFVPDVILGKGVGHACPGDSRTQPDGRVHKPCIPKVRERSCTAPPPPSGIFWTP